ncbi:MAG TPA: reverse transcriptase domain-containing protein [Saprospiraceae bacterium]|jgi:retron-type reverse transcriptase|nr:reverse transcriptase domain-containing protein [Saprospiraceae bacterium]
MKRLSYLMPRVYDPDNLRLAAWKAAKGKRHSAPVLAFQDNFEENIASIRQELIDGTAQFGGYTCFKIFDPKERQICAPPFREQVIHHALMNVCHDRFEAHQVSESYASRIGKGVHAALEKAKTHTRHSAWYLKLDVKKFFDSVHHGVSKGQLAAMFKDVELLTTFYAIIDSYEASPERGVPIGNLSSQYFANHYLTGLDRFIKQELRVKAYVRYMDDLVLWHHDKFFLKDAHRQIRHYIAEQLSCEVKPEALNRTVLGLPFLGFRIFPHNVMLTHHSQQRFIRKMKRVHYNYHTCGWSEEKAGRHALSLLAFVKNADTQAMRAKLQDILYAIP